MNLVGLKLKGMINSISKILYMIYRIKQQKDALKNSSCLRKIFVQCSNPMNERCSQSLYKCLDN